MPKPKWNLNTIYISERLQESLRPISRCAMTIVVAPMGYGKTTAVNWYLAERAKAETLRIIRVSVYSDNLAIFWKSVQEAFARAGFPFLRDYRTPQAAGCWWTISATRWQMIRPAISSSTISTCSRTSAPRCFSVCSQTGFLQTCI